MKTDDFISRDSAGLWHAHGGGAEACWRPPSAELGWYCPYGTFEAAHEAADRMISFFLPLPQRLHACLQATPLVRHVMHHRYEITGARKRNGHWEFRSRWPGKRASWHRESVIVTARLVHEWATAKAHGEGV